MIKTIRRSQCLEDVSRNPIFKVPKRSLSCDDLDQVAHVSKKIEARSTLLWKCIDSRPFALGGRTYLYVSRKESDDCLDPDEGSNKAEEINSILYPAIELTAASAVTFVMRPDFAIYLEKTKEALAKDMRNSSSFSHLDRQDVEDQIRQSLNLLEKYLKTAQKDAVFLKKLGIEVFLKEERQDLLRDLTFLGHPRKEEEEGEILFQLPDQKALEQALLRHPKLGISRLVASKGIASDLNFFFSWIHSDALLSDEKEFVHDMHAHLISLIRLSIDLRRNHLSYAKKRFHVAKLALSLFRSYEMARTISADLKEEYRLSIQKNHQKMEILLGVLMDTVFSFYEASMIQSFYKERHVKIICLNIWKEENPLSSYLTTRFKKKPSLDEASLFWEAIKANEELFDHQRSLLQK